MIYGKYIYDFDTSERLDKYVFSLLDVSREKIKKGILSGSILLNLQKSLPKHLLKKGDEITILEKFFEEKKYEYTKKDIEKLKGMKVYENEDFLVIDKPKGLIVHSGNGAEYTLSGILENAYENLPGEEGRKGIVHRLDKDTSGLMIIAKNEKFFEYIKGEFKDREVHKKYICIVKGKVKNDGLINLPIGRDLKNRHKMCITKDGKEAKTYIKVIASDEKYSVLDITLLTGRTHQIRVHMSYLGYPLLGDNIYSSGKNSFGIDGQVLESYYLDFTDENGKKRVFKANLNKEIIDTLKKIKMYEDVEQYLKKGEN